MELAAENSGDRDTELAPIAGRLGAASFVDGPIARTLLLFALPILGGSVLQSLNGSINAAWVDWLLGSQAFTASTNANALLGFFVSISFGMGMVATILVGQNLGARDIAQVKRVVATTFIFFLCLSLIIAAVGFILAPKIIHDMGTPADAAPFALAYLRVIFLAIPPIFLVSLVTMALRGAGDARTPFFVMLLSVTLDAGLNPLLIKGAGFVPAMGISGAALATVITQWLAVMVLVFRIYRQKHVLRIGREEWAYFRIDHMILRSLVMKGVPMGLQPVIITSSMIAMISLVNRYGSTTVAAYGACVQIWNYMQMPGIAVGTAVSSMVAQNIGAQRWNRISNIVVIGIVYGVLLTGLLVTGVLFSRKVLFYVFLGHNNGAIAIAEHMNRIVSWSFVLFGISFVLSSAIRSSGAVMLPLLILLVSIWGIRLPVAVVFTAHYGVNSVLWSYSIGSIVALFLTIAYYRFGAWRKAKMLSAE